MSYVEHSDISTWDGSNAYGIDSTKKCGEHADTSSSEFVGNSFVDVQIYFKAISGTGSGQVTCSHNDDSGSVKTTYWSIDINSITSTTWYGNGLFSGTDAAWVTGDRLTLTISSGGSLIDVPLNEWDDGSESWDGTDSVGFYESNDQVKKDIFFKCQVGGTPPSSGGTLLPPPVAWVNI